MSQIFISYRWDDALVHAARIFERLRDRFGEHHLFFDQDSIEMRDHFPDRIDAAIRSAEVVLVVIGPDWLDILIERAKSPEIDFVRQEVSIAVKRKANNDQVDLIPLLVGGADMPQRHRLLGDLHDSIGPLFCYQALTFQGPQPDQDHQFNRLFTHIENSTGIVPRASITRAVESPVVSIRAPAVELPFPGSPPAPAVLSMDTTNVERTFRAVSRNLLDWPQKIEGHWIDRPELGRLRELTSSGTSSVTILLGGPGEGKSAMLARLGSLLAKDGALLLAIKADLLPREVASLRQLDDWIDCGINLETALRRLAAEGRVVVLIDQLDALGELMVQHSERLSALLRLVERIRDTPNLHVILSCREFEFRHDMRLNTLQAEAITLAPLPWDRVVRVLSARGVNTDGWSDEVRAVLSTPHNLAIYLQLLAQDLPDPDFTNYQALLDRVIRDRLERVYGDSTVRAAERIAAEMATEEDLFLARARFDMSTELQNLESAGILVSLENGLRVSFRHQTLFDVLRARSFLRGPSSLADFVLDQKRQSLFVRPTLWSALNYLRESDPPTYRKELRRLWQYPTLRLHLSYLLIAFLGQVSTPTDEEAGFLMPRLDASETRSRVVSAMAGNVPGWFSRVRHRLPQMMTWPPWEAWATVRFLGGAINQDRNAVLILLHRHWIAPGTHPQHAYLKHALYVLRDLRSWDSESLSVANQCIDRMVDDTPENVFMIQELMAQIAQSRPDLALKLLGHYLRVSTRRLTEPSSDAGSDHDVSSSKAGKLDKLFSDTMWYRIGELFDKHPRMFIEHVWSWFLETFEQLGRAANTYSKAYRSDDSRMFSQSAGKSDFFQKTFEQAIRGFAEEWPDDFLVFVKDNESSDLNVVHRLLALGLEHIAAKHPRAALRYLMADPRRLAIGDLGDDHCVSVALIAAATPALGVEDAHRLEDAIIRWRYYSHDPDDYDAKSRADLQKCLRQRRLPLLRAFPFERLSPKGQRYLQEEERAFPDSSYHDPYPLSMRSVDSPMSAEQMGKASDKDLIQLFETLTDATEWHHPKRRFPERVGGSIQASREFAKFAKTAPNRALRIIASFEPGKMERPAGDALAALGASDVPADTLIECIRRLDGRGFTSEPFRMGAARCLQEIARRNAGLDDDTCELLEGWIKEHSSSPGDGLEDSSDDTLTSGDSILWGLSRFVVLPQGNYPILKALMLGYLLRRPSDLNGCLAVLERHLKRHEDPRIWCALTIDMYLLIDAGDDRGIRFISALFDRYPKIPNTKLGVRLIGHLVDRLPDRMTSWIVEGWVSGDWAHGPQAAGEIAALNLCRKPDSADARERVERFLRGDNLGPGIVEGLRTGLTHTLSRAWHDLELRPLSTRLLVRIISSVSVRFAPALQSVFRKSVPLPADAYTRELLGAVLEQPSVLIAQKPYFLVESLKELLYEDGYPVLVYDVARKLIEQTVQYRSDSEAVQSLSGLTDLALTLHRIPQTREHGLDLFERLLEADAPGLSESLRTVDRPAFR